MVAAAAGHDRVVVIRLYRRHKSLRRPSLSSTHGRRKQTRPTDNTSARRRSTLRRVRRGGPFVCRAARPVFSLLRATARTRRANGARQRRVSFCISRRRSGSRQRSRRPRSGRPPHGDVIVVATTGIVEARSRPSISQFRVSASLDDPLFAGRSDRFSFRCCARRYERDGRAAAVAAAHGNVE